MGMRVVLLAATLFLPAAVQAQTSSWYAGGSLTRLHIHFEPDYLTLSDGLRQTFVNEADGVQVDLLIGRRHQVTDRFSFGYQGAFSANGFAWSLSIPEPAEFEYSLPRTLTASFVPEVRLGGPVSIFAEVGGGAGFVRQLKTGSTLSTYRVETWRPVGVFGGGARVKIAANVSVFAAYRVTRYSGYQFDTLNQAGQKVEHVEETPSSKGLAFGLRIEF
jgi:opacity protein-like surface antigen